MSDQIHTMAIVGCGKIAGGWDYPQDQGHATTHAQACSSHQAFRLIAAVDSDAETLRRFQQVWDIPRGYRSVEEMTNSETPDVVIISSPDDLHFSNAEQVLSSPGRPRVLLIEKPVCSAASELERLKTLAQDASIDVVVNHTRRFDPAHQQVAKLIHSGELGPLIKGNCTYYGGWTHNGVHLADTLGMLFGDRPKVVSAVASGHGVAEEQNLDVILQVGGGPVTIEAFDDVHYQLFESEFRFQRGRVRFFDFGKTISIEKVVVNELGERVLTPTSDSPLAALVSPMGHVMDAIDAHLRGGPIFQELGIDLSTASLTMGLVWQARDMALDSRAPVPLETK